MLQRREFLQRFGMGLGTVALAELLNADSSGAVAAEQTGGVLTATHHPPRAKRIIFLFQSGAPSQMDLFDHKPLLNELHGQELPDSVRGNQRLTGMSGNQSSLPLVGSPFQFAQHGSSGMWFSELLPHTAQVADELCMIHSLHTEAINHGPGVTFMQTGAQLPGRPSMGAWLNYGLGSENSDLPGFVVLITKDKTGQPLGTSYWGNGFLPVSHQGVRFRSGKDPILYLENPPGVNDQARQQMYSALNRLHEQLREQNADPAIEGRIAQYEMAYRMQSSIPEATRLSDEPEHVFELYGADSRTPGTYAANCLLARRLAERGVRFIQLYHQDWDHHGGLPGGLRQRCQETDQASAALILDLKQRGLLDDTLVVWGGEFGRTNYCQGKLSAQSFGRDHHPRCFTMWLAGGGVRGGTIHGLTDPFCYNILEKPVHIHDFHATLLHLLGIDHERLTYRYQGRAFRLTDVHGHIVREILA